MPKFTLFEIFIVVHIIMDFIFQREWESRRKSKEWPALGFHCFIYTIGFIPVFLFFKVSFWWLMILFLSHFIIDNKKITQWILSKLKGFKQKETSPALWTMMLVGMDQTLHLIVLLVITAIV